MHSDSEVESLANIVAWQEIHSCAYIHPITLQHTYYTFVLLYVLLIKSLILTWVPLPGIPDNSVYHDHG